MSTINRINSSYTVFYDAGTAKYWARCNTCGGTDYSGTNKATIQQNAVDALTSGGSIYLKENTLDGTVTYGATILIVEDYQGKRTFYRNNTRLRELADPTAVTISGTFSHPDSTAEQDLIIFTITTPTIIHELTLDFSNLTQNTTIRVYKKFGANWKLLYGRTLAWETTMDDVIPLGTISSITDAKVTIQSAVLEGASRDIPYSGWKEVWS